MTAPPTDAPRAPSDHTADPHADGFSPDWLRLREPFDHAARSSALTARLAGALANRRGNGPLQIVDLACGIGSSFRYLAPRLGGPQDWRLLDIDPALLAAAPTEIARWAVGRGHDLGARGWTIQTERLDLRVTLSALEGPVDAVVTSALLDLVDLGFLGALAATGARLDAPLLAVLSVDGRVTWGPPDPRDAAVMGWFRDHQETDRGFGASPGVRAAQHQARALEALGFEVHLARADWQIPPSARQMLDEMAAGVAHASGAMSPTPEVVRAWLETRRAQIAQGVTSLTVGHLDLLALPG